MRAKATSVKVVDEPKEEQKKNPKKRFTHVKNVSLPQPIWVNCWPITE